MSKHFTCGSLGFFCRGFFLKICTIFWRVCDKPWHRDPVIKHGKCWRFFFLVFRGSSWGDFRNIMSWFNVLQIYPKKGISPIMLFWGWNFSTINPTRNREGSGIGFKGLNTYWKGIWSTREISYGDLMLIKLDFYVSYRDGVAFICYDQPVWYDPSIKEALDFSDQNNSDDLLVFFWGGWNPKSYPLI